MIINSIIYVNKNRQNQLVINNSINFFTKEISLLYQQYILLKYSYTSLQKNELMYYETYKPRTPVTKKTALNSSTARRIKGESSVQRKSNMRSLNNSHQKSQSRYGSHSRKSKSKNKFNILDKKVCKIFLLDYDSKKSKKCRHIAYIPQTIRFKDSTKNSQNHMSKTQKIKRKQTLNIQNTQNKQNKQNKQNQLNQNNKQEQHYIPNRELLKTTLKPNKLNFMARASNVYDLLISKVMLPQFIEYFLGQALYVVNKNSKNSSNNNRIQSIYDWRLDQFKKICQKIYQNSQEQDLKHFMSLSLPTINRWSSKQSSTKNSTIQPINTLATHTQNSRITDTISTYNNKDRANYFRCLNKKDRVCIGEQKQSIDIIDKLNFKLDNYLKNNLHKIGKEQRGILSQTTSHFNKWDQNKLNSD